MSPDAVLHLVRQALEVTLLVSAPLLLAALVTGLLIGVLQAATQINEATLSFIPKLVAIFAAMVVGGPWMAAILVDFTRRLLTDLPRFVS